MSHYLGGAHNPIQDRKYSRVPFINVSEDILTLDFGTREGLIFVPPNGLVEVPTHLTVWREGGLPPIVEQLAPQLSPVRIVCQTCDVLLGQRDASGTVVTWEHEAPCGLPCIGRGKDAEGIARKARHGGRITGLLNDKSVCVRCSPKACVECKGKGYESIAIAGGANVHCTRCKGHGRVHGLELWRDSHEEN